MPRPIANIGAGNPATYKLGGAEAFTVLAVTFNLIPAAGAGGDEFAYLDWRDPTGKLIHLQPLAPADGANMFYSLAVDASELMTKWAGQPFWPQNSDNAGFFYVSQRLTPVALYAGCTLNAYKTDNSEFPPSDPIAAASPHYTIPDLHLWVQDAGARKVLPPEPPPLLTHIAA